MIFKNSLSASWPVRELSSPRLDWPRVGLSASCPVSVETPAALRRPINCCVIIIIIIIIINSSS